MYFLKYFEILSFLIVIKFSCGLPKDEKFKCLEACLTLNEVPTEHIVHRDSGRKYDEMNWQWNTFHGFMKPMAYLQPNNVTEIRKAVFCCKKLNVPIVVRGGGNSYSKSSFGSINSLIVDMSKLRDISIDVKGRTCDIGAGARIGFINYALRRSNFLIPLGNCPTLGIAGLALGGGWGYFTRMYGLTSDNIQELEMVDADGSLLVINAQTNSDLFFSLRGAGAGSYGIVTKLKFKMYPIPDTVVYGLYIYDFNDFSMFYQSWQFLIQKSEFRMFNLGTVVESNQKNQIVMEIFHINADDRVMSTIEFIDLINSFNFPNSTSNYVQDYDYTDFLLKISQYFSKTLLSDLAQLSEMDRHFELGWKKAKSFYVDYILDKDQMNELKRLLSSYVELCKVAFYQNGGAMNKFSRTETAFVHRDFLFDVEMWCYSPDCKAKELRTAMSKAMATFYEGTKKPSVFNHKESNQNYLDEDIPDALDRYYKENLKTLIDTKARIDPDNIFYHHHSIPSFSFE